MPRKSQSLASKKSDDARLSQSGRMSDRDGEYEDIEESRSKSSRTVEQIDEVDDKDIVEEIDLDAYAEGDGPDA
jgi:hypothetical protein